MNKGMKTTLKVLNIIGGVMAGFVAVNWLVGLKLVFTGVILSIALGVWLILQSGIKTVNLVKVVQKARSPKAILHLISGGFGLLTIYLGLLQIPSLAVLSIDAIVNLSTTFATLTALIVIAEIFID